MVFVYIYFNFYIIFLTRPLCDNVILEKTKHERGIVLRKKIFCGHDNVFHKDFYGLMMIETANRFFFPSRFSWLIMALL